MSYIYFYKNGKIKYCEKAVLSDLEKKEKCTLSFDIKISTDKETTETSISTIEDFHVDACFTPNKWEHVIAQADIYSLGTDKFCLFVISDCADEKAEMRNVKFNAPLGELFGGGRLYQIPPAYAQNMGYVYLTKKGKVVVVDGGNEQDTEELTSLIMRFGGVVDYLFVTHYHNDHICAVIGLFKEKKVKVKILYYNFPSEKVLSQIKDSDNHLVKEFIDVIPQDVKVFTPKKGDIVKIDELTVTVLNDACFDIRPNFSNDSSVMYKFDTGKSKILFTGDIGAKGDDYIKDEWFCKEIKDCNVVQMAHHGQRGASKDFYDKIENIEVCLYPAPWWLFNGWDTPKTRSWMRERGVLRSCPCVPAVTLEIK